MDKDNTTGKTATPTNLFDSLLNFLQIYIERGVRKLAEKMADQPTVRKIMAAVDDELAELAYQGVPGLAGLFIGKIQDSWFGTHERAEVFREMCREMIKVSLDELRKANDPNFNPDDLKEPEKLAEEAKKKVEDTEVWVDTVQRVFHLSDCLMNQQKKFRKATLKQAIEQGMFAAGCCHARATRVIEKAAAEANVPKRPNKKRLSAADVIGMAPQELQEKLNAWLGGLKSADAAKVREYLAELDDEYELRGILAIDEKHRIAWMALLKEKSSKQLLSTFGRFISEGARSGCKAVMAFGSGVIAGANNVLDGAKKLDDSLAPLAARLKTEADRPMDTRGPLARLFRRGN